MEIETTLRKVGGSLVLTVPPLYAQYLEVTELTPVIIKDVEEDGVKELRLRRKN